MDSERIVIGNTTGTIYRVHRDDTCGCWTYSDELGYGPSLGRAINRHETPESAKAAIQGWDWEQAAWGSPLTREAYESECARLGVECLPDQESSETRVAVDSYGVRWGDFSGFPYTAQDRVRMRLAGRRLQALDKEKEALRQVEEPPPSPPSCFPWGVLGIRYDEPCSGCGRTTEVDNSTDQCRRCSSNPPEM
jgi:hypothetical protein